MMPTKSVAFENFKLTAVTNNGATQSYDEEKIINKNMHLFQIREYNYVKDVQIL